VPKGPMRKVQTNRFAMTPQSHVQRSAFDSQHTHKTTFDAGKLIPFYVDEVLPGDSFRVRLSAFARLATAIVPVLDNLIFETFFFFVPNRLVWSNWERFMGEQLSPSDSTDFVTPQMEATWSEISLPGSIYDYLGITVNGVTGVGVFSVNALPFRAYNLIYNDWFRDEDLVTPLTVNTDDGPDTSADTGLQFRMKRHDYFTTCRPWPSKPVMMPGIGGYTAGDELRNVVPGQDFLWTQFNSQAGMGIPVSGLGVGTLATTSGGPFDVFEPGRRPQIYAPAYGGGDLFIRANEPDGTPSVRVLVNDIRTGLMFQQWMERNARGGTRYAELVRKHFGVTSPDARLQRPEYLGGGRTYITTNPVAQTSASGITGSTTVLGEQAATGTVQAYDHGFSQSFTEHGIVLGILNVRADYTYQQGNNRMWFRKSKFDYFWPDFAHLGEQAVIRKEIFADGSAEDDNVFGYQERWAEYKYLPSRTSGYMRSSVATPLDMWHFGEFFNPAPVLNGTFMLENPPLSRVLQTGVFANQSFFCDLLLDRRLVRPMPMYSIPGVGVRL